MALRFQRLTRPAIRTLQPGDRLQEHGITADKQQNGDVRYSVNVMVDGKRVHRVVGRESDGVTREQAERYIEKVRTEAREGRLDLPQGRKLHRSFSEAAGEYLQRLEDSNGKDLGNKTRHLNAHLVPYFGRQRLDHIKPFALQTYRKKRLHEGASDATVNREMSTFLHMMNRAVDWKWIKADQKPKIERAKETRKKIRILTPEQADALMRAAMQDQDGRLWLFVAFGLGAAMRHSEILRVRYDEIDFDNCRIWIDKAKAGQREQPITPALRDALRRQQAMEDDRREWVFPSTRRAKAPHRTDMATPFGRAVVRAGMDPDKVTPHIMRHTAITRLVQAGVDLPTIQKISGHKTVAMVLHYTHVHGAHIDNAISALDMSFPGAVTPELHTPAKPKEPARGRVVALKQGKSAA